MVDGFQFATPMHGNLETFSRTGNHLGNPLETSLEAMATHRKPAVSNGKSGTSPCHT
jgi:hypothetical protein